MGFRTEYECEMLALMCHLDGDKDLAQRYLTVLPLDRLNKLADAFSALADMADAEGLRRLSKVAIGE